MPVAGSSFIGNDNFCGMKKLLVSAVVLLLGAGSLFAQERGKVEEVKDPEIDALIAKRAALYSEPHDIKGYRVQLYNGSDRETYIEMRNRYRILYPEGESHLNFEAEKFSLQVGNCRTLAEASKLRDKLLKDFEDATVVETMITVNPRQ